MARGLAAEWPRAAEILAHCYWPGPLTLVLPKRTIVPDIVTAGLPTVGLRMPAHPLALELDHRRRSAHRRSQRQPLHRAFPPPPAMCRKSLGNSVDLILDGGPTQVGIESTVLSLAGPKPLLLRPGMISRDQYRAGDWKNRYRRRVKRGRPRLARHAPQTYSPRTPLVLQVPSTGHGAYCGALSASTLRVAFRCPQIPPTTQPLFMRRCTAWMTRDSIGLRSSCRRMNQRGWELETGSAGPVPYWGQWVSQRRRSLLRAGRRCGQIPPTASFR